VADKRRPSGAAENWAIAAGVIGLLFFAARRYIENQAEGATIVWKYPYAPYLGLGAVMLGFALFNLRRQRSAGMAFTRVDDLQRTRRGLAERFSGMPGVLRMAAVVAIAFALGRPQTFRVITKEVDSIDIMIVFDISKSMEENDLPRDRLDAAQRVVRRFVRKIKNDRVGLVVFAARTMLQCPLTHDTKLLDRIVADMQIGDVHEFGTAIGDGLGLALSNLKRSDAKSKIVILLSDGDSNTAEHFDPEEASKLARDMGIKVFTILIGAADGRPGGLQGGVMGVNPAQMQRIAEVTGGQYYQANNQREFEAGFKAVRETLEKKKRIKKERIPDKDLFWPLLLLGAALLAIEQLLSLTRYRRFP
jgi:Ca-activated chloride channel family protein